MATHSTGSSRRPTSKDPPSSRATWRSSTRPSRATPLSSRATVLHKVPQVSTAATRRGSSTEDTDHLNQAPLNSSSDPMAMNRTCNEAATVTGQGFLRRSRLQLVSTSQRQLYNQTFPTCFGEGEEDRVGGLLVSGGKEALVVPPPWPVSELE